MRILCLDDTQPRQDRFADWFRGHEVVHVYTADEAIQKLHGLPFDLVMLDHDLAAEHYIAYSNGVHPGDRGTGMEVALFIAQMTRKPGTCIIHSWNRGAAFRMNEVLRAAGVASIIAQFNVSKPVQIKDPSDDN